jgi:lipopolysaccharide biosynthesis glycosyltransferase
MGKINVCLSCDDGYSKYAGVTIASILNNSNEDDILAFYILDGGISEENKSKIFELKNIKNCDIFFMRVNEEDFEIYKQIKTHKYITLQTYYRLKLASIIPDVDKIIYLDCDMIVNSSLADLYNADLHENVIGGVLDVRVKHKRTWKNCNYINAGMVLFDLNKIRQENVENLFYEYTKNNIDKIETGDQDIINFALEGKIEIFSDEWNVQVSDFMHRSSFTKTPKIIHYVTGSKPWVFGSVNYYKNLYFQNLSKTVWAIPSNEKFKWGFVNQVVSIVRFVVHRPLFLFGKNFYKACYYTYLKK